MRRIGVIGGGLAGLTVARSRARAGDRVVLFEANARLGGQLWSERADGFVVEHGAEGFVADSSALRSLAEDLGIADQLVDQLTRRSLTFDGGELTALGPGEAGRRLGFQVPERELGRGLRTFLPGMQGLSEALARALEGCAELHRGRAVRCVAPRAGGPRVSLEGGEEPVFDAVVVATGAVAAAHLLGSVFETARALAHAKTSSSVTVSLAYSREALDHALDATGFVVAEGAQEQGFRACTFVSSKFAGRAPADKALLRVFFRPEADDLVRLSDAEWTARAERALARALGVRSAAERAWVSRWPSALPIFDAEHRARVAELEAELAGSGIRLAGSAFHGAGIDGAVRSAQAAATALDGSAVSG